MKIMVKEIIPFFMIKKSDGNWFDPPPSEM